MAVYRPKRKGGHSRFYLCEFVLHGKRIQESTRSTSKTVAKEYEKRRRVELERAAAGMPTDQNRPRLRTVSEAANLYLNGYRLNHRPKSILFAEGRLKNVTRLLLDRAIVLGRPHAQFPLQLVIQVRNHQARHSIGPFYKAFPFCFSQAAPIRR